MADHALIRLAEDAEDVASGLRAFRDNLPRASTVITAVISELFALSTILRRIDQAQNDPHLQPSFYRIHEDIGRLYASLQSTLDNVFDMFARSRDRSRQMVWDDLQYHLRREGLALHERMQCYRDFLQSQDDIIHGHQPLELRGQRMSLITLLDAQQVDRLRPERFERLSLGPSEPGTPRPRPRRPSVHRLNTPISPTVLSDDWDYNRGPEPPPLAPEVPPLSPTFTSSSSQTLDSSHTSYSSTPYPPQHWATMIFDGQYDTTPFGQGHQLNERSVCHGTVDSDSLRNLAADGFHRALELPFDREQLWMRLYWRPVPDKRSRILIMTKDGHGRHQHFCSPLNNLKIIRLGSCLQLCRARRDGRYSLWARLNFQFYERMVLFYCTFVAMKHQDTRGLPSNDLLDDFELKGEDEQFEKEEFGGVIVHGNLRHALRLFRDRTSGVVRLEACALRGPMKDVPLWTAFVTRYKNDPDHVHYEGRGSVSLAALRPPPYVFFSGYAPPRNSMGEYVLQFERSDDARQFVESWTALCRVSPYR